MDPEFEDFFFSSKFRKLCHKNQFHVELNEYLPGGRKTGSQRCLRMGKNVVTGQDLVFKVGKRSRYTCNEIDIVRTVNHPFIVPYLWGEVTSEFSVLCMEKAHEDSIQLIDRHGRLPEAICRKMMNQIFQSLVYLHDQGIAHRDIKLDNFLLDKSGDLKLSDFEFATRFDPLNYRTDRLGTYEYSSPELRKGWYIGPEVDVWASGVCLYAFTTGFFPFKRDQLKGNAIPSLYIPPHVSPPCADLIIKLLHPSPEVRITAKQALEHPYCQTNVELLVSTPDFQKVEFPVAFQHKSRTNISSTPPLTNSLNSGNSKEETSKSPTTTATTKVGSIKKKLLSRGSPKNSEMCEKPDVDSTSKREENSQSNSWFSNRIAILRSPTKDTSNSIEKYKRPSSDSEKYLSSPPKTLIESDSLKVSPGPK